MLGRLPTLVTLTAAFYLDFAFDDEPDVTCARTSRWARAVGASGDIRRRHLAVIITMRSKLPRGQMKSLFRAAVRGVIP